MMFKSRIKLIRLVVYTKDGLCAYDESFHDGVNIIRGENSSGKSTILNLIHFVLGGDYINWNPAASQCHCVLADVLINESRKTLRRYISTQKMQPMEIYEGGLNEAIHTIDGWKHFGFKQTENKLSFTNILFNALSYPEVKSDMYENTNITMNQILRLMFIDQESPTSSLFRTEDFDQTLTREAISELLLGIYDDQVYQLRLQIKDVSKQLLEATSDMKALKTMFHTIETEVDKTKIEKSIEEVETNLRSLEKKIVEAQTTLVYVDQECQQHQIQAKVDMLNNKKYEYNVICEELASRQNDIQDTQFFIAGLQKKVDALRTSMTMRDALGELHLAYCPQCLASLPPAKEGECSLCHQPVAQTRLGLKNQRILQEIELQIKESSSIQEQKQQRVADLKQKCHKLSLEIQSLQHDVDLLVATSKPTTNTSMEILYEQRGELKQRLIGLEKELQLSDKYNAVLHHKIELSSKLQDLQEQLETKTSYQQSLKSQAMKSITSFAAFILSNDLKRQPEFMDAKASDVDVDFRNNSMQFKGSFNYSASSNTYLKNAIRFAILYASATNDFMRFPRFIICDNIEDKGMEAERSQNMQRLLVHMCDQSLDPNSQIIISTSMIPLDLNTEKYCIGESYNHRNKSLKNIEM